MNYPPSRGAVPAIERVISFRVDRLDLGVVAGEKDQRGIKHKVNRISCNMGIN